MQNEKELRAQLQQQIQEFKQQLSNDDLEKVAGGFALPEEMKQSLYNDYVELCKELGLSIPSYDDFLKHIIF